MIDWTPAQIALLERLWAEGKTAAQIAAVIGCTRNAAVGKAHRLKLPGRPSPVKRGTSAVKPAKAVKQPAKAHRRLPTVRPRKQPPAAQAPETGRHACRWPLSADRPWIFCGKPALVIGPYCPEHDRLAHKQQPLARL